MAESLKLIIGIVGVLIGMFIGFTALVFVMQQTEGALFARPALGVLVSATLVGGGAAAVGYFTLWLYGEIEQKRRRAERKAPKRKKK